MVLRLSLFSAPAQAPTIPNTDKIIAYQENTVKAVLPPNYPFKLTILGVLGADYDIKDLIRLKYPGMANLLSDLAKCEATWQHDGLWGDNYKSYGAFQFRKKTFYNYCEGDWQDMEDQLDCAVVLIKKGLGPKSIGWKNCWRIMNLWKYEIH